MGRIAAATISALILSLYGASAFAFSNDPAPSGPGVQSQFSDPDEAVENIANGATGGSQTAVGTGAQTPSGATPNLAKPADAEPVNPNWPAWMVWHQR